jgi:LPXTG-site transpeptidase (sortase) family protein
MTSTTVNRKVYVSVSTMAAMLLLLIGSIAVSRTANDTTVLAEPTPTTLPLSVDTTVESSTSVAPTTSTAQARAPFAALAARSEFPAMTDTTETDLLADIPNDGKSWLVIPRLHLRMQVVSGISDDKLALGVGWYRKSQKPGKAGNIGLAGHRTTFPAPFYFLDKMQTSDSVLLIVGDAMYRYAVKANSKNEPYDIVQPDNTRVLSYLGYNSVTLTTCTPIGTANQRLIVHAKLASRSPIDRKN